MKKKGNFEKFYNYGFPAQAALIICKDESKGVNVFTVAWHAPLSKNPPLFGMSLSQKRYSRELIEKSGEFTVNFMPYELVDKVDFCGTHSGRDNIDKIKKTGLTLENGDLETPHIKESTACFECKLYDKIQIGDHWFIVGNIKNILFEEDLFNETLLDIEKVSPCFYLGGGVYTKVSKIKKKFD